MLGLPDLPDDPAYATNPARVANREALVPMLQTVLNRWTRDDILAALEKKGVPAGPINTVAQAFEDAQIRHRQMAVDLPHTGAAGGTKAYIRTPIRFSDAALSLTRGAPRLGEHTAEILREIGWED